MEVSPSLITCRYIKPFVRKHAGVDIHGILPQNFSKLFIPVNTTEIFLIAMAITFSVPYLIWRIGRTEYFAPLVAAICGKLLGTHVAGKIPKWKPGESALIGWLLQTKALIMIIFANVLLDIKIITNEMFTASLLMAVASAMLTIPIMTPRLARMKEIVFRSK